MKNKQFDVNNIERAAVQTGWGTLWRTTAVCLRVEMYTAHLLRIGTPLEISFKIELVFNPS